MALNQKQRKAEKEKAEAHFARAIELNNAGRGREAIAWFEKAAMAGHPDACLYFAIALSLGQFTKADPQRAISMLEKAAKAGHPHATQALASAKIEGFGCDYDWPGAIDLVVKSAKAGDAVALRQLAVLVYLSGDPASATDMLFTASRSDVFASALLLRALHDRNLTFAGEADAIGHCQMARFPLLPDLQKPLTAPTTWEPSPEPVDWAAVEKTLHACPVFEGRTPDHLHESPDVTVLRDELPGLIGDYIVGHAAPQMRPAHIIDPRSGQSRQDPYRRANATTFAPLTQDIVISVMDRILMKLCGLPFENAERMGVLSYVPGDEYKPHYDCFIGDDALSKAEKKRGGQRVRTILLVLSDGFEGGDTDFPRLGITVHAGKGSIILFDNVDKDGAPAKSSQHAGLPVTAGTKWMATKWIRANPYVL